MFQNIEELKNEIDIFRNNMNCSNGSIAMISEAIEKLNTNTYTLKQISEQVDLTRGQLEAKMAAFESNQESNQVATMDLIKGLSSEIKTNVERIESSTNEQSRAILSEVKSFKAQWAEKVDKLQEQMLEQFKIAKVLSGVTIGLLVLSIVLNIVC